MDGIPMKRLATNLLATNLLATNLLVFHFEKKHQHMETTVALAIASA
jgi:hypothetical protein